jgi:fructoselysine 6-kinase
LGVSIIAPNKGDLDHIAGFDVVHTGRSSHVEDHVDALAEKTQLSFDFAIVRDPAWVARIAPRCFLASFSGGDLSLSEIKELFEGVLCAGARWCLVTRGRLGALLAGKDGITEVPAASVKPLDTLGAGDTFIARTLVGLLKGEEAERVLSAASEAAGETCKRFGAFGYPAPIAIDEGHARTLGEIYALPGR